MLKRVQIIAAANMRIADKDLRHRPAATGALCHLRLNGGVGGVNFSESRFFGAQQILGHVTIAAGLLGVDGNIFHRVRPFTRELYISASRPRHNPCKDQHIDTRRPAPEQGARRGIDGCARSQHVIDQHDVLVS